MLVDLVSNTARQGDLFGTTTEPQLERRGRLLGVLDTLNVQMGCGTLRFAAEGTAQAWRMRRDTLTPGYTTDWEGLMVAKC